jgi:hypothetical protein
MSCRISRGRLRKLGGMLAFEFSIRKRCLSAEVGIVDALYLEEARRVHNNVYHK